MDLVKINAPLERRLIVPGSECLLVYPADYKNMFLREIGKEDYGFRTVFGTFFEFRDHGKMGLKIPVELPFVVDFNQTDPARLYAWFQSVRNPNDVFKVYDYNGHPEHLDMYMFRE